MGSKGRYCVQKYGEEMDGDSFHFVFGVEQQQMSEETIQSRSLIRVDRAKFLKELFSGVEKLGLQQPRDGVCSRMQSEKLNTLFDD